MFVVPAGRWPSQSVLIFSVPPQPLPTLENAATPLTPLPEIQVQFIQIVIFFI